MLTQEQEAAVTQTLASLDLDLANAFGQVDTTWATFGAGGSKDAAQNSLNADFTHIESLRGPLLDRVRLGTDYSFSQWSAFAKTIHDDIAYQSGLTGEWSLTSVLKNAASATVTDIKAAAPAVALGLGTLALVVVAVLVLRELR